MAFVQSSSELTQSTTTATVTVTAGNLLVFYVSAFLTGTLTISDDKGNTWTRDVYQNIASAGIPGQVAIYSAPNAAGGSTTFTLSGAGGSGAWGRVLEFSGRATASVVDASSTAHAAGTAPEASVSGITGTGLDDVVAVYLFDRDARAISGPSGFTNIADGAAGFAWNGYRAGYNPSAERGILASANTWYSGAIVAYKPAAAAAGFGAGATLTGVIASGSLASVMSGFAAGATLGAVSAGGSLGATPGVFVLGPIKVSGTAQAGVAIDWVRIYSDAGILLYERTGGTLDGTGSTTLTTSAAPPGTAVRIDWQLSGGRRRMPRVTMG